MCKFASGVLTASCNGPFCGGPRLNKVSRKQSILQAIHVTDVAVRVSVQPAWLAVCHSAGKQTRVPVVLAVASCLPDWKLACRSRAASGPLVTCSGLGTLVRSLVDRIGDTNRVLQHRQNAFRTWSHLGRLIRALFTALSDENCVPGLSADYN